MGWGGAEADWEALSITNQYKSLNYKIFICKKKRTFGYSCNVFRGTIRCYNQSLCRWYSNIYAVTWTEEKHWILAASKTTVLYPVLLTNRAGPHQGFRTPGFFSKTYHNKLCYGWTLAGGWRPSSGVTAAAVPVCSKHFYTGCPSWLNLLHLTRVKVKDSRAAGLEPSTVWVVNKPPKLVEKNRYISSTILK